MAKTILGRVSINPCGQYEATKDYARLDIVTDSGNSYICLKDNIETEVTNTIFWFKITSKGDAFKYADFTKEQLLSITGPKGYKGDPGTGLKILGTYSTLNELREAYPDGSLLDGGFMVLLDYYYWNINTSDWESAGQLQGAKGDDGIVGSLERRGEGNVVSNIELDLETKSLILTMANINIDDLMSIGSVKTVLPTIRLDDSYLPLGGQEVYNPELYPDLQIPVIGSVGAWTSVPAPYNTTYSIGQITHGNEVTVSSFSNTDSQFLVLKAGYGLGNYPTLAMTMGCCFAKGLFYSFNIIDNRMYTSANGLDWTPDNITIDGVSSWVGMLALGRIVFANNKFIAYFVTEDSSLMGIISSTDGFNWQKVHVPTFYVSNIYFLENTWFAIGVYSDILISEDGESWNVKSVSGTNTINSISSYYQDGTLVFFGGGDNGQIIVGVEGNWQVIRTLTGNEQILNFIHHEGAFYFISSKRLYKMASLDAEIEHIETPFFAADEDFVIDTYMGKLRLVSNKRVLYYGTAYVLPKINSNDLYPISYVRAK